MSKSRFGTSRVVGFHKSKETKNPSYYYVSYKNTPQGYKEHVNYFIAFDIRECVTIIYCLENMKLYVSNIEESYKDTLIGHLGNLRKEYLLLHIVQCWSACEVDE